MPAKVGTEEWADTELMGSKKKQEHGRARVCDPEGVYTERETANPRFCCHSSNQ